MLDPAREQRLAELFAELADAPTAEQAATITSRCGDDVELAAALRRLLQRDASGGRSAVVPPRDPEWIGPYRIEGRLGEGGMGVVFAAQQEEPFRRRVALKVVRATMLDERMRARFLAERQALARMEHPGIARIYDAGVTAEGAPWFAMERIDGETLLAYVARRQPLVRARLELFAAICAAVQHAHQRGILHRDLKPQNVLVAQVDGVPVPKVIDFGVARAMVDDVDTPTLRGELVGTPDYMSPEQCELGGPPIDSRSDVWALGVILYELLTGSLPFARFVVGQRRWSEVVRERLETTPPRPSVRAGKTLRGDLDWITMRCLEREPERRYASVSELLADVQRHLQGLPVLACPPSLRYRLGKLYRRHRAVVVGSALLAATVVLGLVGTLLGWLAARERNEMLRRQLYAATVLQTQTAVERGNWREASQLLRSCPEDLRGFEWAHLDAVVHPPGEPLSTAPDSVALFPHERGVLRVGADGVVEELRAATPPRRLFTTFGAVVLAEVAARADLLVTAHADGRVALWSREGRARGEVRVTPPLVDLAVDAAGRRLAVATGAATIQVFDVAATPRPLAALRGELPVTRVRALAFSPDGSALAAAGSHLEVFDANDGRRMVTAAEVLPGGVDRSEELDALTLFDPAQLLVSTLSRVVARPWASLLAGRADGIERDWAVAGGRLAASADELRIARAGSTLTVINPRTGELAQHALPRLGGPLCVVTWSGADHAVLADHTGVRAQPLAVPCGLVRLPYPGRVPDLFALAPRRAGEASPPRLAANHPDDAAVMLWQGEPLMPHRKLAAGRHAISALAFANADELLVGTVAGAVLRLGLGSGERRELLPDQAPADSVASLHVCAATGEIGVVHVSGALRVVARASSGPVEPRARWPRDSVFATDPAGPGVLVGGADGSLERYAWRSGSRTRLRASSAAAITALAPCGADALMLGFADGGVELVDLRGRRRTGFGTSLGAVTTLVADPAGERALVRHGEVYLALWDLGAGARLLNLPPTYGTVGFRGDGAHAYLFRLTTEGIGVLGGALAPAEAAELVALPLALGRIRDLRRQGLLAADMAPALRADATLRAAERALAERIAAVIGDDPNRLNEEAWRIVRQPGRTADDYRRAQRLIDSALQAQPGFSAWLNTKGLALYRCGEFAAALTTLRSAEVGNRALYGRTMPHDVAFQAMAAWQLGQRDEASASLVRLRELAREPVNAGDDEVLGFLHEAEGLIGR